MASFHQLRRSNQAPAKAGPVALRTSPFFLTVFAAIVALLAVSQLAGSSGRVDASSVPRFLSSALGSPRDEAPLVRATVGGTKVAVSDSGYRVAHGGESLSITAGNTGDGTWKRFANGVSRQTETGHETIVFEPGKTEEFLTVESRQGLKTWRWSIEAGKLTPRVTPDGSVDFLARGKVAGFRILPVAVYDVDGSDVTPAGLRWALRRDGSSWALQLRLDDSKLPLPYVIDPAVTTFRSFDQGTNGPGATTLVINKPAGVAVNDFLIAQITARGGSGVAISPPDASWTLIDQQHTNGTALAQAVYWKVAGASEPASYTWTLTPSQRASGGIIAYYGVDNSNPIVASSVALSAGSSTQILAPSITVGTDDRVVGFWGIQWNTTVDPPAEMAPRHLASSNSTTARGADYVASGATGDKIATAGKSQVWIGQLVGLRLDSVAPPVPTPSIAEASPDSHAAGSTLYYRPVGAGATFTVDSQASDGESGLQKVNFPGLAAGFTPATAADVTASPYSRTYSWTTGATESGSKTLTVTDNATNTQTGSFTITPDASNPPAPVATFPAASPYNSADWNAGCATAGLCGTSGADTGSGLQVVEISIRRDSNGDYWNGAAFVPSAEIFLAATGLASWSYGFPASSFPADGDFTIRVRATDNVANTATSATTTFTYDTTAPVLPGSLVSSPLSPANDNGPEIAGTAEAGSTVQLYTTGDCSGAPTATGPAATFNAGGITVAVANDSSTTFKATATDAAGNASLCSASSVTYVEDSTIPTSSTSFPADAANYGAAPWNAGCGTSGFCGTYADANGVQSVGVSIRQGSGDYWNGTSFGSASEVWNSASLAGGNWSYGFPATSFPADGSYTVRVRAVDNASNTEAPASRTFNFDATNPSALYTFPAAGGNYSSADWDAGCASAGFCGTYSDATSGVQQVQISVRRVSTGLYWNGSSFGAGSESFQAVSLAGGNWSYGFPASSFPAGGDYTVHVRATDNAGNQESGPSRTFAFDTTPPETSIDSNPANPTSSANATFTFSADEPGSTFECELDSGGFSACTSPKSYASLSDGGHTFRVRARDGAGNTDPTPAAYSWTVDTTAPSSTVTFPAVSGEYNGGGWNAGCAGSGFCGTHSDATTSVQSVELSIRQGSGDYWNGTSFGSASEVWNSASLAGGNWSYGFPATSFPADGSYTVRVRAIDQLSNTEVPSSRAFAYDTADPSALFSFPAAGGDYANSAWNAGCATVGFCGSHSDSLSGVQAVEVSIQRLSTGLYWNGSSFGAGSETFAAAALAGGNWSFAFPAASFPADGQYTVHARARDDAGNTETGPSRTFRVDNADPSALYSSPAAGGTYSTAGWNAGCASAGLCGTASDAGSGVQQVEISLKRVSTDLYWNGSAFGSGSETFFTTSLAGSDWAYGFPATNFPADGGYTVHVRARDNAGNTEGGPTRTFTIDTVAPNTTIDSNPSNPSGSANASFTFSATEGGSTFECELNGGGFSACMSPQSYFSLADGSHTFRVRAADPAGNPDGSPASYTWTVDTTAPSSTMTFPASGENYNVAGWNAGCATSGFCGTYSDATSGVQKVELSIERESTGLFWNGASFSAGSETFFLASLAGGNWSYAFGAASFPADGDYTIRVKATDNASNPETPSSRTFTFDATAPTGSVTAPANGAAIRGSSVTVSSDSADGGSGVSAVDFERRPAGGGSWTLIASDGTSPYSVSWDTTMLTDGDYELRAVTADGAGNTVTSATVAVTADNTNPSIATLDPLPGAIRNGQVLTGSGSDATSGVESISYYRCAGPPCAPGTLIGSSSTGPSYPVTWNSQPADGDYEVLARVSDRAGNTLDSANQTVTLDNTNPTGSLTAPADGAIVSGIVAVASDSADSGSGVTSAAFERRPAGGGAWVPLGSDSTAPYSVDWDTNPVPDGDYDLRVVTTDAAGNSFTSATRTVRADNNSPTVTLTAPAGFVNAAAPDPFTVTASSPDGDLDHVEFFRCSDASAGCSGGSWVSLGSDSTAPYTAAWTIDADGNRALRALAVDGAANTGAHVVNVTIDRAFPTGSLTAPADGAFLAATVAVSSDSADSGSGVAVAVFERRPAGGGAWTQIDSDSTVPYSVSWDTSSLNGDFDLHVVTTDAAGNSFTSPTRTVTVDNTAPSAPVVMLAESSPFAFVSGTEIYLNTGESGSYDVAATSADAQSGIEKIRFPGPLDDTTSPYGASYSFGDLSGAQTVTAFNRAGLTASSGFTVTADTAAPTTTDDTASIGSAWQAAPVTVTLTPGDAGAGVAATYYATDGSNPTTSSAEGTSVVLSTDGVYTIKYFSVDNVGNAEPVQTASTLIRIDRTNPSAPALTLSESSPFAFASGATVYVNTGQAGTFTVAATASDAGSGLERIRFPGPLDDFTSPYQAIYAFSDLSGAQAVTAFDLAGNSAPSSFTVTPDTAGPAGGSVSYPDGYDADGQVTISTADGTDALSGVDGSSGVIERRTAPLVDGVCDPFTGGWTSVTSPNTVATDSCAQYRYRVSDRVGNEAIYTSTDVVKTDLTAPSTTIDSAPSDPTNDTSPTFTFSASETGSTFECELDAGGFQACTSPTTYAGPLGDGPHTFRVRATDPPGNTDATPATFTWTVDTGAPDTTVDSGPANPTNDTSPTFSFSASETGSTFECELDAGGFQACASPKTYAGPLGDGSHTVRVRATDSAGNTDGSPASFTWTVDTAPPNTTIDSAPPDPDTDPTPTFAFSASEGGSTFECELDAGGFQACTSPQTFGPLTDGSHTVRLRATDPAGNTDATPAAYTWILNFGPPTVTITAPGAFVNAGAADPFTVTATSPDSDIADVEFFRCTDASTDCSTGSWVSLGTDSSAPYSASWPLPADGNAAVRAVATDTGSNTGAHVVNTTVDRTLPVATIGSAPGDPSPSANASFSFSTGEAGATFECRLDGAAYASCTSPQAYSSLADGGHTFDVRATDPAGNVGAPDSHTWTIDTLAPDTTLTSTPGDPTSSPAPSFSFVSSEGGSTFECELDGAGFAACVSPKSYAGLADGSHTFRVRATDAAGLTDATPASFTWTIDSTAPGGGLVDPGSPLRASVTLSASPSDAGVGVLEVTFEYSPANLGLWTPIGTDLTAPYSAAWDTTLLPDGLYDLRAIVTDNAMNVTVSAEVQDRLVDNTAPTALMNDPGAYLRATVSLTSSTSDSGSGVASVTYERSPAGAASWSAAPASWDTTGGADGLYDLRVVATDAAGNSTTSAPVINRRIDNTAPSLASSIPSEGALLAAAGSLVVAATEDVATIFNASIDGAPAPGPVIVGATVTYTFAFADGPHTFAGELEDLAGNRRPIRVHFTVWSLAASDYPFIEKNWPAALAIAVAAANGGAEVSAPANGWSGGAPGDWIVLRVDPRPATPVDNGFELSGDILDVTAYWALAGGEVHSFIQPIHVIIRNGAANALPMTLENGAWRAIASVPSGQALPGAWQDGFYREGSDVHVLTLHLSSFSMLRDVQGPSAPGSFRGAKSRGRLLLSWKASADNSGLIAGYVVYGNGAELRALGSDARSVDLGAFKISDKRKFQVAAKDAAGNIGTKTHRLVIVPSLRGATLATAKSRLAARGLKPGKISRVRSSSVPAGRIIKAGRSGVTPTGAKVALTVSLGGSGTSTSGSTGGSGSGGRGSTGGTSAGGSAPSGGLTPPSLVPSTPPAAPEVPAAEASGQGEQPRVSVTPASSSTNDKLRRALGLALLSAAFMAALLAWWRLRRVPAWQSPAAEPSEIVFWDQRLTRLALATVRRVAGRF